ncbi:hypothetical protein L195_g043486 [Trifolium pratense]|uniref:Uncharacterized protein n=1 Tax=Trifolium pratense TaxID=57577 RepID=A0A2K3M9E8_TRIPR|nr:hypothetical protein L195_g043486 [Trifolium pratense]
MRVCSPLSALTPVVASFDATVVLCSPSEIIAVACTLLLFRAVLFIYFGKGQSCFLMCSFQMAVDWVRRLRCFFLLLYIGGSCYCIALISDSSGSVEICSFHVVGAASVSSPHDPVTTVCFVSVQI